MSVGGPVDQRVELQPALLVRIVELEARQVARGSIDWNALRPGDPGVEARLERLGQRLDLADLAAAVGILAPAQARLSSFAASSSTASGVRLRMLVKPELLDQRVAIGQRFGEHACRVSRNSTGIVLVDLGDEVQQHRALGAEARDHRDIAERSSLQHARQHLVACPTPRNAR